MVSRLKVNLAFVESPYGITLILLTLLQFALLWVVSFYTEGNLSPATDSWLKKQLACHPRLTRELCSPYPEFRTLSSDYSPNSYNEGNGDCDRYDFTRGWRNEIISPTQAALFMLSYPRPMEAQTFVILVQVFAFFLSFHVVLAEILTSSVINRLSQKKLFIGHITFAVLFFICAVIETVYAASCAKINSTLCGIPSGYFLPTFDELMAGCACPLVANRVYAATAFFWIFFLVHLALAYFVARKMKFTESCCHGELFNFDLITKTRVYGKALLISLVLQFIFLWVASFFKSDGSVLIVDSNPVSGFLIGFPQWYRGATFAVLVTFFTFWIIFEFMFVEFLIGDLYSHVTLLTARIIHGVFAFLMVTLTAFGIGYVAFSYGYGSCDYVTFGFRAVGILVMSLVMIINHALLVWFVRELYEPLQPRGHHLESRSADLSIRVEGDMKPVKSVQEERHIREQDVREVNVRTVEEHLEREESGEEAVVRQKYVQKKEQKPRRSVHYDEVIEVHVGELNEVEERTEEPTHYDEVPGNYSENEEKAEESVVKAEVKVEIEEAELEQMHESQEENKQEEIQNQSEEKESEAHEPRDESKQPEDHKEHVHVETAEVHKNDEPHEKLEEEAEEEPEQPSETVKPSTPEIHYDEVPGNHAQCEEREEEVDPHTVEPKTEAEIPKEDELKTEKAFKPTSPTPTKREKVPKIQIQYEGDDDCHSCCSVEEVRHV